jgi:tetratricopeptide (TPR) repeat protein
MRRRIRRRPAFIILFGSRNLIGPDEGDPIQTQCPRCNANTTIVGKSYRPWFTLFFLPVFPIGGKQRFSQCVSCKAQFSLPVNELRNRLAGAQQQQSQQAIGLYNSLRQSPANSITLNELMQMYAGMSEFDQAISAARDFPEALNSSEQCMCTLGRVFLAAGRNAEAIPWFDAALARNPSLGEAHYHKAVACLTLTPARLNEAVAAARAARNAGYPRADELLREAEAKARA